MKNIVIIGAGPSGCMAAISAKTAYPHHEVILIERNTRIGEKLRLSGGGRCNVSANVSAHHVIAQTPRNGRFLFAALASFNPQHIKTFFASMGCPLVEEDHQRLFPRSQRASDIVDALLTRLQQLHVKLMCDTLVTEIDIINKVVITTSESIKCDHLILACGGKSYAHTGSDGVLLQQLSRYVPVERCYPAETPLVSNDPVIQSKQLQGVALKDVHLTMYVDGKKVKQVTHDLLFTHFGFSGPGPLQCSSVLRDCFEQQHKVTLVIDMVPHLSNMQLEHLLKEQTLRELLVSVNIPKRVATAIESMTEGLTPLHYLKAWTFTIHDMRGFNQAFVTSGGVSVKAIDPKTMKLKAYPHVSVCGEMVDVHSHTGGYNITLALSMGYHAGKHCLEDE